MTLSTMEFLRRFVQHVLPRGFVRIRHFGYLATACRTARLALACTVVAQPAPARPDDDPPGDQPAARWRCPHCGAAMIVGAFVTATHLAARRLLRLDSS